MLIIIRRCLTFLSLCTVWIAAEPNLNWYKNAVIYQIYPWTFIDSNGDGVGDIAGIKNKLSYLKDTGITAIWLPPIHEGPLKHKFDHGYEAVNYEKIDKSILTKDSDFDDLIAEAHQKGLKVILGFVPNHSSVEHSWFLESSNKSTKYQDYYVWRNGKEVDGQMVEPNNWKNHVGESAWTYVETRDQWYLHQFAKEQPDLNYRNSEVKTAIENALKYWLNKGVDGIWIDSAPYLVEGPSMSDETEKGEYTKDVNETFSIIGEWRRIFDEINAQNENIDPKILITSADSDIKNLKLYCGDPIENRAHLTLNHLLLEDIPETAIGIINIVNNWITNVPKNCTSNWMLGSHQYHRMASRFSPERVDGLHTLLGLLPGIMFTYNGEEIGQKDGVVHVESCKDPVSCTAATDEEYQQITKDLQRTPFHWDGDSKNAGFSESDKVWLPVSPDYVNINLNGQMESGIQSHYHVYQEIVKLRQIPGFQDGDVVLQSLTENIIGLSKSDENNNAYIAVINVGSEPETVHIFGVENLHRYAKVVFASSSSSKYNKIIDVYDTIVEPFESFVAISLPSGSLNWWREAVIYQIYPLSFKDSNNDGFGDLQGIISRLPHLVDAGFTATWLSPIFKSPKADQGYDISDFMAIDEVFGTMEDFKELIKLAHESNIRILLDFVPNHSSNQHEWFKKSEAGDSEFKDFYVWANGNGWKPPNNWVSEFKGSAWTYSKTRKQYYLHQYSDKQPDLNYRNQAVKNKMKEVLKFWLDLGVDGFRIDSATRLLEREDLKDEPCLPNNKDCKPEELNAHTKNQPETFNLIYEWREYLDQYSKEFGGDARIMFTEANTDMDNVMKYYTNNDGRDGAHFSLNFQFISKLTKNANANDIDGVINEWLNYLPQQGVSNWVLGNHDSHRVASRFGIDKVDGFNMLIAFLPGVMVTYNGEEIGQENGEPKLKDCKDPRACDGSPKDYEEFSRDFERTPFQWDSSINGGFNEGAKPWLPVGKRYSRVNLQRQQETDNPSHYKLYKELLRVRKDFHPDETVKVEALHDDVFMCARTASEFDIKVLLFNVGNQMQTVNLEETLSKVPPEGQVVMASTRSYRVKNELIPSNKVLMMPNEALVVRFA